MAATGHQSPGENRSAHQEEAPQRPPEPSAGAAASLQGFAVTGSV